MFIDVFNAPPCKKKPFTYSNLSKCLHENKTGLPYSLKFSNIQVLDEK